MKSVYARVSILVLLLLCACSKAPVTSDPTLPVGLEAGWNEIKPGGETLCADGSDYRFFVSPGSENKLLVDFEGGGACWNGGLCSSPSSPGNNFQGLYLDRVYGSPKDYDFNGIYDRSNPENPFKNWYHVHISYCTGDLHLGNNTAVYPLGGENTKTIEHKGAVNAGVALGWIFENFGGPETIFVAGVSAGAYPAIVYLPEFAEQYPDAALSQLGDSGAGIVTQDFFTNDIANWQIAEALPELSQPVALDADFLTNLYTRIGKDYPDARLGQYTSTLDGTQIGFYGLMQGITQPTPALAQDWATKMQTSVAAVAAETPNFRFYISALDLDNNTANGTAHVILQRPELYTLETADVTFLDWLGGLADDQTLENVSPDTLPASALGDSPSVSGTIINLGQGDFDGRRLEIKVGRFSAGPIDVYTESPIAEDGSFSLTLPGEAGMTPRLFDARPKIFELPGCDVVVTPEVYKLSPAPDFALYVDGEPVDEVLHARIEDPNSSTEFYQYFDRDVRVEGECPRGDYAGLKINIDVRKGWNTIVFDFATLEYINKELGEDYQWVIASLCTIEGECPTV